MALKSIFSLHGIGSYNISLWACDFCPSQAGAILEVFPDAQIGHCVKHFDSNIGKAIAKNGSAKELSSVLGSSISSYPSVSLGLSGVGRNVESFEKLVRLCKRLPFLPEHDVAVGFKAIGQKFAELFEDEIVEVRYLHGVHGKLAAHSFNSHPASPIPDFLLHIWNTYIKPHGLYPSNRWSVFERMINFLPITSNPVENLHSKMNKYIPRKNPSVSTAIGILKKFEDRDRRALLR